MQPWTVFPRPVSPYEQPIALMTTDPDLEPTVCVKVSAAYIPLIIGSLLSLLNQWTWGAASQADIILQQQRINTLIYLFQIAGPCVQPSQAAGTLVELPSMSDQVRVICDENGKCVLQYRCDVCSDWITGASLDDIRTNPGGGGNQPAPGGGVATYCKTVFANASTIIPTPVNSGDKIEVTSADGSWSGTPFQWRCVDGNIFFVDCTGAPGSTSGSNPVPAAQTMSLIVQFSTGYYALYPGGSLIVPGGVVNEQPTLLANKPTLTSGAGSIDVCIKVTNNQAKSGCLVDDFTTSPGLWTPGQLNSGIMDAEWLPGTGWSTQDVQVPIDWERIVYIHKAFSPGKTVTSIDFEYDVVTGGYDGCGSGGVAVLIAVNGTIVQQVTIGSIVTGTGQHLVWTGSSALTSIDLGVVSCCDTGVPCSTGSALIRNVKICTTG